MRSTTDKILKIFYNYNSSKLVKYIMDWRLKTMKARVNEDLCIGCGACEAVCPEVFRLEGDKAKVIVDTVPSYQEEAVLDAAASCPVTAIEVDK